MEVKRIRCPKCGVVLDVRNSNGEIKKTFRCPRCGVGLQVSFAQDTAEESTTVYGVKKNLQCRPRLIYGGEEYQLNEGRNVIGRKALSSTATTQIETSDHYMSRQHAVVMVTALADGGMKAVLSGYQNKNEIAVDGQTLEPGDEVRLMDDSRITMGNTTVIYKQ